MRKRLHFNLAKVLLLVTMLVTGVSSWGQMTFTSGAGLTQSQLFNGLPTTNSTSNTLTAAVIGQNWFRQETTAPSAISQPLNNVLVAGANTGSLGQGVYNNSSSASSTDRAVGLVASGSGNHRIGVQLVNNTGTAISGFSISGATEKYRNGSSTTITERVVFQYSTNATSISTGTWVAVSSLDLVEPSNQNIDTNTAVDGNLAANRSTFTGSIPGMASGSTIWIRWTDSDASGNDALLAVDDVVITATAPATVPTVTTTATTGIETTAAQLNGTTTANGTTTTNRFEYGLTTLYGSPVADVSPATATGSTATPFFGLISGLTSNTVYHYRAYVTYGTSDRVNGGDVTFTTLAIVPGTVAIDGATATTLNVTLDGTATNGNNSATVYSIQETSSGQFVQANGTLGATEVFQTAAAWGTKTVTGLSFETTYTFRASARNLANVVTAYGPTAVGTTLANTAPVLSATTLAPFGNVCINTTTGPNSFIINGDNLTAANVTVGPLSGYTFSTTSDGTYTATLTFTPDGQGSIVSDVFVKFTPVLEESYSGNIPVTGGGAPATSVTASGTGINTIATITTAAVTPSFFTATLGGTIGTNGCAVITERGVVYGPSSSPVIGGTNVVQLPSGSGFGTFTVNASGLTPQTTYYVRAYTVSNTGTNYGNNVTFTTTAYQQTTPIAGSASDVTDVSFIANWNGVAGAEEYRLDVATTESFGGGIGPVVGWNFPAGSADEIADEGTAANNTKVLSTNTVDAITYTTGSNAVTAAATTTGWNGGANTKAWQIEFASTGYNDLKISSKQRSSNGGPRDFVVQYRIGTDGAWTNVPGTALAVTLGNFPGNQITNVSLPQATFNQPSVFLRWVMTSNVSANGGTVATGGTSSIDDILVTGNNDTSLPGYSNLLVQGTSQLVTGLTLNTTYYYRVRAVNNEFGVTSANSNVVTVITLNPIVWDGTQWLQNGVATNVVPTINDDVFIEGNFNTATNTNGSPLIAKTIRVKAGTLTVAPLTTLTADAGLKVIAPGAVIVENNGAVLQSAVAENIGNTTVRRNNSGLFRLDYSLWSSPVAGQNLQDFSTLTNPTRFYIYNTAGDFYSNSVDSDLDPVTQDFEAGRGYLIRMPNNDTTPGYNAGETSIIYNGEFDGRINNGTINVSLSEEGNGYNSVGNPYPSSLNAEQFLTINATGANPIVDGTIYFWRKRNGIEGDAYASYTFVGGTAATEVGTSDNGTFVTETPNGSIQTGQGFIVKVLPGQGGIKPLFTNPMREAAGNTQFYRNGAVTEKHRIWLNFTNPAGLKYQSLLGYMEGASNGVDNAIDGSRFKDGTEGMYSVINNAQFTIQGRALPFAAQDVVPMGFSANTAGTYTVAIDHVDGLFSEGQDIYLKDKVTGTVFDLNSGAYTFATEAGMFNDRFELVYLEEGALSTNNPVLTADNVVVYKQDNTLTVNAGVVNMTAIAVYDMRGRMIYSKNDVNATETTLTGLQAQQQVLIVQVTTANGMVSKKVVF